MLVFERFSSVSYFWMPAKSLSFDKVFFNYLTLDLFVRLSSARVRIAAFVLERAFATFLLWSFLLSEISRLFSLVIPIFSWVKAFDWLVFLDFLGADLRLTYETGFRELIWLDYCLSSESVMLPLLVFYFWLNIDVDDLPQMIGNFSFSCSRLAVCASVGMNHISYDGLFYRFSLLLLSLPRSSFSDSLLRSFWIMMFRGLLGMFEVLLRMFWTRSVTSFLGILLFYWVCYFMSYVS